MKKIINIILIIIALVSLKCSSYDKNKYINNKKIIKEASDCRHLVSLRFLDSSNKESNNLNIGFVELTDSFNGKFNFKSFLTDNKIENLYILKNVDSVSIIKENEKMKLCLTDNSILLGSISNIDHENKFIKFKTPHKNYTVPKSKIIEMNFFDVSYVKIIFQDGSEIFGTIVKDDGDSILLSTTLGNESYNRTDILRIDYMK